MKRYRKRVFFITAITVIAFALLACLKSANTTSEFSNSLIDKSVQSTVEYQFEKGSFQFSCSDEKWSHTFYADALFPSVMSNSVTPAVQSISLHGKGANNSSFIAVELFKDFDFHFYNVNTSYPMPLQGFNSCAISIQKPTDSLFLLMESGTISFTEISKKAIKGSLVGIFKHAENALSGRVDFQLNTNKIRR